MQSNAIKILSTRPLDTSIIDEAKVNNIEINCISFIETVETIDEETKLFIQNLAQENTAVVFTSMNAADAIINTLSNSLIVPKWRIYCMGGTTRKNITTYFGANAIVAVGNNAFDLAEQIVNHEEASVAFFCGNIRRNELPLTLKQNNISFIEKVVYKTIVTPQKINETIDAILFFSPSAVESFFSINKVHFSTVLFAVGSTTANTIAQYSTNTIVVSDKPEKDYLVQKAIAFFKNKQ